MTKRAWALLVGAVALALAAGLGLGTMFSGGSTTASQVSPSSPTTSEPTMPTAPPTTPHETVAPATATVTATPTKLPEPALGPLKNAEMQRIFDWFSAPIPQTWDGLMSDGDSKVFADTSTCVADDTAQCARIEFLSLRSGPNRINYGSNPVKRWAKEVCPGRPSTSVSGPFAFKAGGVDAEYYKFPCQGGPEHHLWYVPGQLMVRGDDGDGTATVEAGTVQAVLEGSLLH